MKRVLFLAIMLMGIAANVSAESYDTETIRISSAQRVPYCSDKNLNFSQVLEVKAYIMVYDSEANRVYAERVYDVPAKTGILVIGGAGEYSIPVAESSSVKYDENLLVGTLDGTTIYTNEIIDGVDYVNYYLSNGEYGVGFYKVSKEDGVNLGANRSYLRIPLNNPCTENNLIDFEEVNHVDEYDCLLYQFDRLTNTAVVTGISFNNNDVIVIPDHVVNGGVEFTVTSIGANAFNGCSNLTEVSIPNSVTSIGDAAFYNCCNLVSVSLGNCVETIGEKAFCNCAFEKIEIPASVKTIRKDAFCISSVIPDDDGTQNEDGGGESLSRGETDNHRLKEVYIHDIAAWCAISFLSPGSNPLYQAEKLFVDGEEMADVVIPDGVTSICNSAFVNFYGLKSIVIPNSVTNIGKWAFYDCTNLKLVTSEISTPFEVDAFGWFDTSLHSVSDAYLCLPPSWYLPTLVVPKGSRTAYKSTNVWKYFFTFEEGETIYEREQTDEQGICYQLREADDYSLYYVVTGFTEDLKPEIVIPADIDGCPVKAIEYNDMIKGAFNYCNTLTSVILGNQLTTIGDMAFYGCDNLITVKMGKNVNSIGNFAFSGCTSLTSITLPKKLECIGNNAFGSITWDSYCPITSINIPSSVKTIGYSAFQGCRDLALVTFEVDEDGNTSLTSIGERAFSGCSFTSITIPNSVTTIGGWAFDNNEKLTTAILGNGITEIAERMFLNCYALASVSIPEGVTSIGDNAFQMCSSLTSVKLPESLTTIGEYVFDGTQMKSINLPNSITAISANLFKSMDFEYIKLGNNVKSIGKNAFGSSLGMEESIVVIEIGTSTPPTIANDAFPNLELPVINVIVPDAEAEKAYKKAAVWKEMTYANKETDIELTVDVPGDIGIEVIEDCGVSAPKVVGLKVKGAINADDFMQLRSNFKSLLRLDLSECDITEIPDGAMTGKTQLQELILPTKVKTIGNNAFQDCPYLTGKLELPSGVTSIGNSAFQGTYYTSITLPRSLKTIGDYAFYNLPIKQKIIIPDGMTSIGAYAFAETGIYGNITIPDGVTHLGDGAFRNTQVKSVFLPTGITSLNSSVFQGCTNLDEALYIPDNVTSMNGYAFDGCSALTNLRLSANLTSMGEYALQNTHLEYIKVPSKVEVLSEGVFKNCKSLESMVLPANLKKVGNDALRGCNALRNLSVDAIEPPTAARTTFIGVNTDLCIISIPTASYRSYLLAEYWGQFVQMRNDIAVETEGNGVIAFEAVEEGEEEESLSRARARVRSYMTARAATRGSEGTNEPELTYANNGSSVYVPKNGQVNFLIIPGEGESLVSAFLDDVDITAAVKDGDGVYTATADKKNGKLVVEFSGTEEISEPGTATVTFEKAEYTVKLGETFTAPKATTTPEGLTLTYSSSDEKVATVDANTGAVTLVATGSTTITALFAGNDDYKTAQASYKLTVNDATSEPDPQTDTNPVSITVSSAQQVPYYSDQNLDFTNLPDLKAYVATGYDKVKGTIWLTRVKQVPAQTGFLLIGEPGDYDIPTIDGVSDVYYKNMFKGTLTGTTIQTTEGEYTNYYLSKGASGVGFYKVTNADGQKIGANRCYLPILTDIPANGAEGDAEVIKVSAAKQVPYYTSKNIDFTSLEAQGVKAYTATGYNYKTGIIWLTRVKKVPAQTGILVMADKEGEYSVPTTSVQSVYENMFTGSETAQTIYTTETVGDITYINYYLSNGASGIGFYKVTNENGVKMSANRSYLQIPKRDSAGARGMDGNASFSKMVISDNDDDVIGIPVFGGDATGIISSQFQNAEQDVYYNLQGQRVENPRKGVYIKNGKKVVVK